MAIVPPGNKQFGDYTNIVVTIKPNTIIKDLFQSGNIVTRDPDAPGSPLSPKNKFIGDYTKVAVTYKPCPVTANLFMAALVVTKYLPPGGFYNLFSGGYVTTKDNSITTPAIQPVKNKFIGEYSLIAVTTKPKAALSNLMTIGLVVTREFTPRVETLIMNLKYNTPGELTFT